jgi:nucleoside-diphosphate-sugar epimerase
MKVLITGACGFVARGLIKQLEERGHQLVLLDRINPEDATLFWPWAAEGRMKLPLVTTWPYIKTEILDFDTLFRTMQGIDAVVHLAAAVSGDPEQGIATMHANVCGTYTILDAARRVGVPRAICASSVNVFGTFYWRVSKKPINYPSLPLDETFEPIHEDPYSLSKFCNEHTCAMFARAYGMTTAALRFAGVWAAEGYDRARSAPLPPTEAWSDQLYQWVHVDDVVTGIRQALEAPNLPPYGAYTLGAADTCAPENTMDLLRKFQPHLVEKLTAPLPGRTALLSIRKAQQTFGYAPKYSLGVTG